MNKQRYVIIPKNPDDFVGLRTGVKFQVGKDPTEIKKAPGGAFKAWFATRFGDDLRVGDLKT